MPDEQTAQPEQPTKKPPIPRRMEERKPAKIRPLSKKLLDKVDDVEKAAAHCSQLELACAIKSIETSEEQAAADLGIDLAAVRDILKRPAVNWFLLKVQEKTIEKLAQVKVRLFRKVGISQATVEQRLMDLAQMDPSETKGSIDGQVKALRTLAEILGMLKPDGDPLRGKTREELEGFVLSTATRMRPGANQLTDGEKQP